MTEAANYLTSLADLLGGWARTMPTVWRKRVYKAVKIASGLATLALLLLPMLPSLGVTLPADVRWDAVFTGLLAFLGHLADTHTDPGASLVPSVPQSTKSSS